MSPEETSLLNDIGVIYFTLHKTDKAMDYFQKALNLDPENLDTIYNIGILYSENNDVLKATTMFEKLYQLEPSSSENQKRLAALYYRDRRYEDSQALLTKYLEIQSSDPEAYYWKGLCFYAGKDYENAIKCFEKVLEINPDFTDARSTLAQCYINAGDNEKAMALGVAPAEPLPHKEKTLTPKFSTKMPIAPMTIINRIEKKTSSMVEKHEVQLSVVVPFFNEEENVTLLYSRIVKVMDEMNVGYEIIFVDDGSKDRTPELIKTLAQQDSNLRVIVFRRNYGQTAAMAAGFDLAKGEIIITMDGDLQNDPSDIPKLLEKMQEGYDLVSGYREKRKDNLFTRKIPSFFANRIIAKLTSVRLRDYGCTLKAYKSGIVKNIKLYGEMHRFIPALASFLGINVAEIPVKHHPRIHGKTKYGINRTYRVILDLVNVRFLLDYFTRPIQFFGKLSLFTFVVGFLILISGIILRYGFSLPINMTIITLIMAIALLTGVQLIMMGLVGEIVIRTYHESQDKPIYIIKEMVNS
ncbi:MAG: glycosyltransferase [bacterium]